MNGSAGSGQNVYQQGQTYRGWQRTGKKEGGREGAGVGRGDQKLTFFSFIVVCKIS